MMSLDSFIDSAANRFEHRSTTKDGHEQSTSAAGAGGEPRIGPGPRSGHFTNAHDFVLNNLNMFETLNVISAGKTVLEYLDPYTLPDAAMDSSARYPPPTCHPETRSRVMKKLDEWLNDNKRRWNMIWLHGSAGTGKSAVAQTFAERCFEVGLLGAAYFFSRSNNRNKLETVIPSLAYQLAVSDPEYKSTLSIQLINDPHLLRKAPPVQFRKLIVEPYSTLQRQRGRRPILIILDGLDECEGEDGQCLIVALIAGAVRLKHDLPLLWLICSRPEAHLKHAFSKIIDCSREELVIDAECRDDVERYLRNGFIEIRTRYWELMPSSWPDEDQLEGIFAAASGLFVFASTILKFVCDPIRADPVDQLHSLIRFLDSVEGISSNPLAALDLFYMQILDGIPDKILPITWRILAYSIYIPKMTEGSDVGSAQALCNFLNIHQHTFYSALRKLYSVVEVPTPEDANKVPLRFYHTSFVDFLLDPNRSGKFAIGEQQALTDIAKSCLFWYGVDLGTFHTKEGWDFDALHGHGALPGLKWSSADNWRSISNGIASFVYLNCWKTITRLCQIDENEDMFSRIHSFDFRYDHADDVFCAFVDWLHEKDPSSTLLRTKPFNNTDFLLLEYLKAMTNEGPLEPATFPLNLATRLRTRKREYFFIGYDTKSVIIWITENGGRQKIRKLIGDREPSEAQICRNLMDLEAIGWNQ